MLNSHNSIYCRSKTKWCLKWRKYNMNRAGLGYYLKRDRRGLLQVPDGAYRLIQVPWIPKAVPWNSECTNLSFVLALAVTSFFSLEGYLYQVKYAFKAIKKAIIAKNHIVTLIKGKQMTNYYSVAEWPFKITRNAGCVKK